MVVLCCLGTAYKEDVFGRAYAEASKREDYNLFHLHSSWNRNFCLIISDNFNFFGMHDDFTKPVVPGADKVFQMVNGHVLEFSFGKTIGHDPLI